MKRLFPPWFRPHIFCSSHLSLLLGLSLVWVAACSNNETEIEEAFAKYKSRLYQVTNPTGENPSNKKQTLAINAQQSSDINSDRSFPLKRDMEIVPKSSRINLLELLRLSRCEINAHIAQHNAPLAKLQGSEEQLFYDLKFIRLAQVCLAQFRNKQSSLYRSLRAAQEEKLKHLNYTLFNAIFVNEELQTFFSDQASLMSDQNLDAAHYPLQQAIGSLSRFVDDVLAYKTGNYQDMDEYYGDFISALQILGQHKIAGKVLATSLWLNQEIDKLNREFTAGLNLCTVTPQGQILLPKTREQALLFVFKELYLSELQSRFARLQTWVYDIQTLGIILKRLDLSNEHPMHRYWMQHWHDSPEASVGQFKTLLIQHSKLWETSLKKCRLL